MVIGINMNPNNIEIVHYIVAMMNIYVVRVCIQ